jgi:pyruvate dehydrogenase E2 component (dihydrolipoamide acetyltransferase)
MEGTATAKGEGTAEPLTRAQRQVARRVAESRATVPSFVVTAELGVGAIGPGLVGATVVSACARALLDHPRANATYRGDAVEYHDRVNVGVILETGDAPVSATIASADERDAAAIAAEVAALAAAGRDGSLTPPQTSGATFSVTDLSASGVRAVEPIVLPPQVAALTIGGIDAHGAVTLSLACDARVLSAGQAAALLTRIRELAA